MASIKEIRNHMESVQETMKITNAMYLISSAKLQKARERQAAVSNYFRSMQNTIARVLKHMPDIEHPYFTYNNLKNPRRAYLILTSDKGLAGAFNLNVIKYAKEIFKDEDNAQLYVIGQKGYRHFLGKDKRMIESFNYRGEEPNLQRARNITGDILDAYDGDMLDEVYLIYTHMKNSLTVEPVTLRLLPLEDEHFKDLQESGEIEFFPSARSVLNQTAPIFMQGMIFGALIESYCAEQNTRMMAMDGATKNAKEMIQNLQLYYNRTRQGVITQELTEIVSGAAAFQTDQEEL